MPGFDTPIHDADDDIYKAATDNDNSDLMNRIISGMNMSISSVLVIFFCFSLTCFVAGKDDYRQAFKYCDTDDSGGIDMNEFRDCAKFPPQVGTNVADATKEIFRLFDSNKNNELSRRELKAFLKVISESESEVDVVLEDGTKKSMRQTDFMKLAEERTKGMRLEDGQVTRVDEGSANLDQLKKDNPELARFIIIGQWAREMMEVMGYASGAIVNMKSLDDMLPPNDTSYRAPTSRYLEVSPPVPLGYQYTNPPPSP